MSAGEARQRQALCDTACAYVESLCRVSSPDSAQTARLEMLAAAYALRLCGMCDAQGITSFTAGDVKIDSSADRRNRGEDLWNELCAASGDLIDNTDFLFGRVTPCVC